MKNKIYSSTILLEPNRWKRDQPKLVLVSEWLDRINAAGFDGIELFEPHFLLASTAERNRILSHPIAKPIFNSYLTLDAAGAIVRSQALSAIEETGATAFKFNLGKSRETAASEVGCLMEFLEMLPDTVEAWCECHPDTSSETAEAAAEILLPLGRRVKVMVHPFLSTAQDLQAWLDLFGENVAHAHVQVRAPDDVNRFVSPRDFPEMCEERLGILRKAGYAGSFSIEFVSGTRAAEADTPPKLFEEAVRDRAFLLEKLGQG
jgi:sugar phosphate isomerase/epimerase